MNSINITGNLTQDPELKQLAGDKSVCRSRVAIDNGQYDTDYIDVAEFGASGAATARLCSKGDKVAVSGRLSYSEWETEVGGETVKRSKHEIVGRVEFLQLKGEPEAEASEQKEEEPTF